MKISVGSLRRFGLCGSFTEVIGYVLQVWLDDGRMKVFVVSEQLQVSGVVLKIRL